MKNKILHMIGNAHLDPVWLWQWQEGFQEAKSTFRSILNLMDEYEDFLYTSSSAAIYEWVEKNDPQMFEEIRARIAEGRWEIVGGWWIQPDCNLPSGESFVRQGLYGQRYFKEKFGVTASIGYNVDSFGHHAMLPQILLKSGMPAYIFMRPQPYEKGLPGRLFWWESDDGSQVLTYRIPYAYNNWSKDVEMFVGPYTAEMKEPFTELMYFYGVGNHGGGPTRENLATIRRLNDDPAFPTMQFSTPNRFFDKMRAKELPFSVVHDELQHHASGCYAAHSGIKRWNRQAENLLLTAEKWSAIAERVTGQPYPSCEFDQAWKNVLFNQFHDILAGTSLEAAYDDARNEYGEAIAIATRSLNYAVQALSWQIDIPQEEGMKPIVAFNPHAWQSRVSIELDIGGVSETTVLLDDQGNQVPMQLVQPPVLVSGWRRRMCFLADLPPLGYRVYRAVTRTTEPELPTLTADAHTLENERFRLTFDGETGYIASLYDKQKEIEVFWGAAAIPAVIEDTSDTWSHGVYQFQNQIGAFKARSVRLIEHGPVKSVMRVESVYGNSTIIQDFAMYRELDQIDVSVMVDWHEQFKMLKLRFPVNVIAPRAIFEIPYGHIERPTNGEEEPGQSWFALSGIMRGTNGHYGLSILNDGKYSFDIVGRVMSVTVLRSPIYAHHEPTEPAPGTHYTFIDQGVQRFNYTLLPHAGSWEQAETPRRAAELNQRPTTIVESYHSGPLPQKGSFLAVEPANLVVSVVKRAEDSDGLIVRVYETDKIVTQGRITLPQWNRMIEASFGPCEIKTFLVPRDESQPVVETNLIEWVD